MEAKEMDERIVNITGMLDRYEEHIAHLIDDVINLEKELKEKDAEFVNEKVEFGLSVHEAAIAQANSECQARVEGIFKEIEQYRGDKADVFNFEEHAWAYWIPDSVLQALKKQEGG